MKKNGYLRRFLALFLALVMIMADSSVTTFAATVGRVKQKSAARKAAVSAMFKSMLQKNLTWNNF